MNKELSSTHSGLGILPLDLQWKIFELLDYKSARRLTATCRFFRSSPRNPLSFQSKADRDGFLYDAEYFLQHVIDQSFACFHCSTIKPRHAFSEDQVTRNNSKCRAPIGARFCMDCGESKRLYTPGQRIVKTDGTAYDMCCMCSELKMGLIARPASSVGGACRWHMADGRMVAQLRVVV